MPAQPSRRQPLSCEPCRKRKIKCSRDRVPCAACVRRGYSQSCVYLRQEVSNTHRSTPERSNSSSTDELLERIRNLEALLHNHIGLSSPSTIPEYTSTPSTLPPHLDALQRSPSDSRPLPSSSQTSQAPGVLRSAESGYQRYEPWVSQWKSVVPSASLESIGDVNVTANQEVTGFPFDSNAILDRKGLLASLPPSRQCDELLGAYFRVFSPIFHVLHDPTFQTEYVQFRLESESTSLSWLALLFVVLSIAVIALDDDDVLLSDLGRDINPAANMQNLSSRYRTAAFQCLAADQFLWQHNIKTLQALVLVIYSLNHSQAQSWPLLGLSYNIALAIGCHVDPENFDISLIEREERRRCWAGLLMMYTIQNTSLGNLDPRPPLNRVRLPADVDDQDLVDGIIIERPGVPTQMTYILFKFRLYELASEICQTVFGSSRPPPRATILAFDRKLADQQQTWNAKFLATLPLPVHHLVHFNVIYSYSYQLTLLLHRPFFTIKADPEAIEGAQESRARCIHAARSIIDIHKDFFDSKDFKPYQWYNCGLGSFHAFHGAVVLAVVLLYPQSGEDTEDILRVLQDCLARFEIMSQRSNICAKGTPVLRALLQITSNRSKRKPSCQPSQPSTTVCSVDSTIPTAQFPDLDGWDPNMQMDALVSQLQPEQWLNPASMAWEGWDFMMTEPAINEQRAVCCKRGVDLTPC